MTDPSGEPFLAREIVVATLTRDPVDLTVDATGAECRTLAQALDIIDLKSLRATLRLSSPDGGTTVHLTGRLVADVTQACVVTLEPVAGHIDAAFERIYSAVENPDDGDEIVIAPDADEPLETLTGDTIDIGQAVAEQLALEIEPFPRAPGAEFIGSENVGSEGESNASGPFAVLSRLKRDTD